MPEIVLYPEEARAVADFELSADDATAGPAGGQAERAATLVRGARELAARPQVDKAVGARGLRRQNGGKRCRYDDGLQRASHRMCSLIATWCCEGRKPILQSACSPRGGRACTPLALSARMCARASAGSGTGL